MNRVKQIKRFGGGLALHVTLIFVAAVLMTVINLLMPDAVGVFIAGTGYLMVTTYGLGYVSEAIIEYEEEKESRSDSTQGASRPERVQEDLSNQMDEDVEIDEEEQDEEDVDELLES